MGPLPPLPDLKWLLGLAALGVFCAALLASTALGFIAYHMVMALRMYFGG